VTGADVIVVAPMSLQLPAHPARPHCNFRRKSLKNGSDTARRRADGPSRYVRASSDRQVEHRRPEPLACRICNHRIVGTERSQQLTISRAISDGCHLTVVWCDRGHCHGRRRLQVVTIRIIYSKKKCSKQWTISTRSQSKSCKMRSTG